MLLSLTISNFSSRVVYTHYFQSQYYYYDFVISPKLTFTLGTSAWCCRLLIHISVNKSFRGMNIFHFRSSQSFESIWALPKIIKLILKQLSTDHNMTQGLEFHSFVSHPKPNNKNFLSHTLPNLENYDF